MPLRSVLMQFNPVYLIAFSGPTPIQHVEAHGIPGRRRLSPLIPKIAIDYRAVELDRMTLGANHYNCRRLRSIPVEKSAKSLTAKLASRTSSISAWLRSAMAPREPESGYGTHHLGLATRLFLGRLMTAAAMPAAIRFSKSISSFGPFAVRGFCDPPDSAPLFEFRLAIVPTFRGIQPVRHSCRHHDPVQVAKLFISKEPLSLVFVRERGHDGLTR